MKVLVSAYACAPGWGSEPGIGWGVASAIAEHHDVWVLTDVQSRSPLERARHAWPSRLRVEYVDAEGPFRRVGTYISYAAWQVAAYRRARRLHREVGFDIAQHVTYGNSAMPSWMGRLGVPFVWYAGSFSTTSLSQLSGLGLRASTHEVARNLVINGVGRAARRVTLTGDATIVAVDAPPSPGRRQWNKLLLGGLQPWELQVLQDLAEHADEGGLRVLSAGRMLGWKGFHLGLRAFAVLAQQAPDAQYWLIGDGEQRPRLERLAAELGIAGQVRFLGAVSRQDTFAAMADCDVFLHPSWHEQVGFVVLEAMAAGRPVVCVDAAGPPELVGDTGVVVALGRPERMVDGLARALVQLHGDPEGRRRLGRAARRRAVEHWDWRRVAGDLMERYDELLRARAGAERT